MKKVVFGLLVIKAGILLLGFNLGFINPEYKEIVFSWQMLLVAFGFLNLFDSKGWIPGLIILCIGLYFLVPLLPFISIPGNFHELFWPMLLILLGVLIIIKWVFNTGSYFHKRNCTNTNNSIEEVNVFSGNKPIVENKNFNGGKIVNIFGGSEIDLTQSNLSDGKNMMEIINLFGGTVLIVPNDWIIHLEVVSIFGGFADKRRNIIANTAENPKKELIIRGIAIFGGGEIKSGYTE